MIFKRRRPVEEWPLPQLLRQVALCMASDPEALEVHGTIVLHQDPALLPKSLLRQMEADAMEEGRPSGAIDEYVVFHFRFEEDDRESLYIEGDPTSVLRRIDAVSSLEAAWAKAGDWVGPTATAYEFHHMPGIYQTAFVKLVNGYRADLDPIEMAWYLPAQDNRLPGTDNVFLVRDFPPRLEPSPITPRPGRVSWSAMPRGAVLELYRQRGF
jgi:hypothetical protein